MKTTISRLPSRMIASTKPTHDGMAFSPLRAAKTAASKPSLDAEFKDGASQLSVPAFCPEDEEGEYEVETMPTKLKSAGTDSTRSTSKGLRRHG